ncbi:hypothetical protein ACF1AE_22685 [Streptomyces sp. NPDC014986]|uniref:hypothetical protein n=1 Tax=Streptomyces sp. NPDC014986 TaxID=3364934 RepID=UPI003701D65D
MGGDQAAPGLRREPVGDHDGHHDLPAASADCGFPGQWIAPASGKRHRIRAFVMVLPAPRHMAVRPVAHMDRRAWAEAYAEAFRFSGGVPRYPVPDNPRTGVDELDLHHPQTNTSYSDPAPYCRTAVDPARATKPKDERLPGALFLLRCPGARFLGAGVVAGPPSCGPSP